MATQNKETSSSIRENEPVEDDENTVGLEEDTPDHAEDMNLSPDFSTKMRISTKEIIEIDSENEEKAKMEVNAEKHSQSQENKDNIKSKEDGDCCKKKEEGLDLEDRRESLNYKCNCGECFKKSAELAAHKRWTCKLVEKKFQCDICHSMFVHEHGLKRHMKHCHDGDFSCSRCHLRFHNRIRLTRHWMEFHYDENDSNEKLKCFLCGDDSFKNKFDLESHLLIHKYNRIEANEALQKGFARDVDKNAEAVPIDLTVSNDKNSEGISDASQWQYPFHFPHHRLHGHHFHPHHHRRRHCFPHHPPFFPYMNEINPSAQRSDRPKKHPGEPLQDHHSTSGENPMQHHPHHHHHHHPPPPFPPHHRPPPSDQFHPPHRHPPFRHGFPPPSNPNSGQEMPYFLDFPYKKKHCNKWKWKKYFKGMMKNYFNPWFYGFCETSAQQGPSQSGSPPLGLSDQSKVTNTPISTETSKPVSQSEQEVNSGGFKMVCTFCSQVMEKEKTMEHRIHECPVHRAFKCSACDKVFVKHHKLLKHMWQDHGHHADITNSVISDASSTVSSLREKLSSVLDFQNRSSSPSASTSGISNKLDQFFRGQWKHSGSTAPSSNSMPLSSGIYSCPETSVSMDSSTMNNKNILDKIAAPKLTGNVPKTSEMEESSLVIDEKRSPVPFTCLVCRAEVESARVLAVHLQAHITHVTVVKKVHEWKTKSSPYFVDSDRDDSSVYSGASQSTDALSVTTDTSFQDTCSANFSNLSAVDNSSAFTVTNSDKWSKPHKKKKKKGDGKFVFPCEFCDESFAFKKDLCVHMREKHKDKNLQLECPVCHKKFSWKKRGQFYERHLSSHYGVTIYKHKCEICDKTFLEKCKLQAHMARHKDELLHKCPTCGKGYGSKSSLTRHLRQHTGDKPHQCDMCSESFLEKRELIRHMATHTGTPAFVCPQCGQGFTLKTSLDTHIKRKHPQ